jgi:signal transduction histidine kinase
MDQTIAELLPVLRFLADVGAGILASLLFAQIRRRLPRARAARLPGGWLWARLLYAPAWARLTNLVLAFGVSFLASLALAALESRPLAPVADAAIAALIGQLWHAARELSMDLPTEPQSARPQAPGDGLAAAIERLNAAVGSAATAMSGKKDRQ